MPPATVFDVVIPYANKPPPKCIVRRSVLFAAAGAHSRQCAAATFQFGDEPPEFRYNMQRRVGELRELQCQITANLNIKAIRVINDVQPRNQFVAPFYRAGLPFG